MIPHTRLIHWVSQAAGFAAFFIAFFCAMVIYDTLHHEDNITMEDGTARGWNNGIGLVVEYRRAFTVHKEADGEVQRIIRCPPDGTDQFYFEGEVVRRTFPAGRYPPLIRPMQFPRAVPVGTKCELEVWASWRPRFAISSKRWLLDKMPFTVEIANNENR